MGHPAEGRPTAVREASVLDARRRAGRPETVRCQLGWARKGCARGMFDVGMVLTIIAGFVALDLAAAWFGGW